MNDPFYMRFVRLHSPTCRDGIRFNEKANPPTLVNGNFFKSLVALDSFDQIVLDYEGQGRLFNERVLDDATSILLCRFE